MALATPRQVEIELISIPVLLAHLPKLVKYLNDYVIGQENAKKVLSVAYVDPPPCFRVRQGFELMVHPEKRVQPLYAGTGKHQGHVLRRTATSEQDVLSIRKWQYIFLLSVKLKNPQLICCGYSQHLGGASRHIHRGAATHAPGTPASLREKQCTGDVCPSVLSRAIGTDH